MGRVQAPNSFLFVLTARAHRTSSCAPIGCLKAYSVPCSNQYRSRRLAVSSVAWAVVLPSANPTARSRFETARTDHETRQGRFVWSVEDLSGRTRRQCPPLAHRRHNRGGEQRPSAPTSVSCHHASRRLDVALVAVDQPMAVPQLPELAAQARNASTAPAAGAVTVLPPNYAGLARGAASQQAPGPVPMLKPVACLSPSLNLGCGGTLHAASPSC